MAKGRRQLAADSWGALLRAHAALVPVLDVRMRENSGLTLAWYDVLLELHAATGHRLRMSMLAENVTLSRTRVSRIVDELAAADLVCRENNPEDGRSSFAVLTPAGKSALKRAAPAYLAAIESTFARNLDTDELRQLRLLLQKIGVPPETTQ